MTAPPRLQIHIGDYLKDTPAVSRVTWEHHGIYILALFIAWNVPGIRLPNDPKWLALRFGCTQEDLETHVMPVIKTYFKLVRTFWYQKRLTEEHEFVLAQSEKQRARVNVRWAKEKDVYHGNTVAEPRNASGNTTLCNTPTPTPTPTPIEEESKKKSQTISSHGDKNGKEPGGQERVTVKDPDQRMVRFMRKLSKEIPDPGWTILAAATSPSLPEHAQCLAICKDAALRLGKGWPKNWPTDHAIFDRLVMHRNEMT